MEKAQRETTGPKTVKNEARSARLPGLGGAFALGRSALQRRGAPLRGAACAVSAVAIWARESKQTQRAQQNDNGAAKKRSRAPW